MQTTPIGITTTVPIEVLITAGYKPIDLNNLFITSKDYYKYIETAENRGFPKNFCAWIKGLYGVCKEENICSLLSLNQGDCSNTKILNEILESEGIRSIPFSYPSTHNRTELKREIDNLMNQLNVDIKDVEETRKKLNRVRKLAKKIDTLSYTNFNVSGFENHLYQVSCSDFNGDHNKYERELLSVLDEIEKREPCEPEIKLGYIGVPPITGDIYSYIEEHGARVIYNEVQREFSFPREKESIYDQYHDYTYIYSNRYRMDEIKREIKTRKLDAIIHYTQAFCHKSAEDILVKDSIDIPVLHIEGDKLNSLDARTKLRLEAFIDMLKDRKVMS